MPFLTQGNTNWKFLLIVILLTIIVGGAVLWRVNTSEQPYLLSETSESERVTEDETIETVPSEVEGWQIYRNEVYGFEIKYPNNWFVHDATNEINCENKLTESQQARVLFSDKEIEDCLEPLTHGWFWFSIWINEEYDEENIEKNIIFNGIPVNKTVEAEINEIGASPRTSIIFNYNNFGWNINYLNNIGGTPADSNFEKMFSTFRFLK